MTNGDRIRLKAYRALLNTRIVDCATVFSCGRSCFVVSMIVSGPDRWTASMAPPRYPSMPTGWSRPSTLQTRKEANPRSCCHSTVYCSSMVSHSHINLVNIHNLLISIHDLAKGPRQRNYQPLLSLADDLARKQEALQFTRDY